MAHVPNDAVVRGIEDIVNGNGQLHGAQVRTQVTTGFGNTVEQEGPELMGQGFELRA